MPYWFETKKIKLPKNKDRRRKLTDKDKKIIKPLYDDGFTISEIARKFEKKVCRRMIQFILFPERKRKQNWKDFYDRKKHTIAIIFCPSIYFGIIILFSGTLTSGTLILAFCGTLFSLFWNANFLHLEEQNLAVFLFASNSLLHIIHLVI